MSIAKSENKAYRDAKYHYYPHGPLARIELGDNQVQGQDYYYTLQGWLKGVNDPGTNKDTDGKTGSHFAVDEVQYQLGYYQGDYAPIQGTMNDLLDNTAGWYNNHLNGLYNGNIAMMATNIRKFSGDAKGNWQVNEYQYDQLNRIISANGKGGTSITSATTQSVSMAYSYDPNGNIKSLTRNGILSGTSLTPMDELTYNYNISSGKLQNNKLKHVDDVINASNYTTDIDDQTADNYTYDEIGNLIQDDAEGIEEIKWTVYGKIERIDFTTASGKPDLRFLYDAFGNRVAKIVETGATQNDWKYTFYVRDAQGNVLYTETKQTETTVVNGTSSSITTFEHEYSLYGSSMLGVLNETTYDPSASTTTYGEYVRYVGRRQFQLENHLGNILATISDYKTYNVTLTHYEAVVLTASDYDPFGFGEGHRKYEASGSDYRFGFNGKETDSETDLQDYGFRIYNPALGKFLSIDPLFKEFSSESNYIFAGSNPLYFIDKEGLKKTKYTIVHDERTGKSTIEVTHSKGLVKKQRTVVINSSDYYKYDWYHTVEFNISHINKEGVKTTRTYTQEVFYGTTNIGCEALILDPLDPKKEPNRRAGIVFTTSDPQLAGNNDANLNGGADYIYSITNIDKLMTLFGVPGGAPRNSLGFKYDELIDVLDFLLEADGTVDKLISTTEIDEKVEKWRQEKNKKTTNEKEKIDTFPCDFPNGCDKLHDSKGNVAIPIPKGKSKTDYQKK